MALLVNIGKAFFTMGLAMFMLSLIYGTAVIGAGYQIPPVISDMMNIFKITGVASIITFVGSYSLGVFFLKDVIVKSGMFAFYTTLVVASIGGIIGVLKQIIGLMPFPSNVSSALIIFITTLGAFSIGYYAFYQLGYLPEE